MTVPKNISFIDKGRLLRQVSATNIADNIKINQKIKNIMAMPTSADIMTKFLLSLMTSLDSLKILPKAKKNKCN